MLEQMNENCLTVSVITVVYNDRLHIKKTIENVLAQDYPYVEYIIVDGDSTDGTKDIIQYYASALHFVSEQDDGIYNAMNKGMRMATGDYMIFMNSGDCFTKHSSISEVMSWVDCNKPLPVMIYGNYRKISDCVSSIIPARSFRKVWYGAFASHQSSFYNRSFLLEKDLWYDESYRIAADYKLNLALVRFSQGNILYVPVCVSDFDMFGLSSMNQDLGLTEADRARQEVLQMGWLHRKLIIGLQLGARFFRTYFRRLYEIIRTA